MRECNNGCLASDTMILMANGSEKRISEIRVGESVMLNTGKAVKIIDIFRGEEQRIISIMTNNGELKATDFHPILLNDAKWTKAGEIELGDIVCTLRGDAKVESLSVNPYNNTVYNLFLECDELINEGILANGIVVGDYYKQNWLR